MITLQVKTGDEKDKKDVEIGVPEKVAFMSGLIKQMIDSNTGDGDEEGSSAEEKVEVPLPNVTEPILRKCLEFMDKYSDEAPKAIEKPLRSQNMKEVVPEWDANYINVKQEMLFEIILAANYLDVKTLLDLACAKVASLIKGKTPKEIRETFNVTEDFTPAEEIKVRTENPWLEDV